MIIFSETLHRSDNTLSCNFVTELDLITEFDLFFYYLIHGRFHRTFAMDVYASGDAYSSRHLGLFHDKEIYDKS